MGLFWDKYVLIWVDSEIRGNSRGNSSLAPFNAYQPLEFGAGDIDLAIRYGSGEWSGVRSVFLLRDELFLTANPEMAKRLPPLERIDELKNFTVIHCAQDVDEWPQWAAMASFPIDTIKSRLEFESRSLVLGNSWKLEPGPFRRKFAGNSSLAPFNAPLCVEPGAAVADQASLLVTTYGLKGNSSLAFFNEVTMRKSYGFRTFRITEIALYHVLGKLPEPELTQRFY